MRGTGPAHPSISVSHFGTEAASKGRIDLVVTGLGGHHVISKGCLNGENQTCAKRVWVKNLKCGYGKMHYSLLITVVLPFKAEHETIR